MNGLTVRISVPGPTINPKNVSGLGLWKHRRLIRAVRLRAQQWMLEASCCYPNRRWPMPADSPKRVSFVVYLPKLLDDDSLAFAISPIRDALGDMGLIGKTPGTVLGAGRVKDGPKDGHVFEYKQVKSEKGGFVGVEITVSPLEPSIFPA